MKLEYLKYAASIGLVGIIEANPDLQKDKLLTRIFDEIKFHIDNYQEIRRKDGLSAIYSYMMSIDESTDKVFKDQPIACKRGCSFCCRINVDMTHDECLLITEYCRDEGIAIDTDILEAQKDLSVDNRSLSEHRNCAFLDGEKRECKIYPVRPVACRKYVVVGDPNRCDFVTYPKNVVQVLANLQVEILASAICNQDKHGNMATILLNILKSTDEQPEGINTFDK